MSSRSWPIPRSSFIVMRPWRETTDKEEPSQPTLRRDSQTSASAGVTTRSSTLSTSPASASTFDTVRMRTPAPGEGHRERNEIEAAGTEDAERRLDGAVGHEEVDVDGGPRSTVDRHRQSAAERVRDPGRLERGQDGLELLVEVDHLSSLGRAMAIGRGGSPRPSGIASRGGPGDFVAGSRISFPREPLPDQASAARNRAAGTTRTPSSTKSRSPSRSTW